MDKAKRTLDTVGWTLGPTQDADTSVLASSLDAIVESSTEAIIGKTLDGTITFWNHAAEELYGYRREEVVGTSIAIIIPPDHRLELKSILSRLANGERVGRMHATRRRKDGTIIEVSVCISPIRDRDGNIIGASSIAHDVTERQRIRRERATLLAQIQEESFRRQQMMRDILFSVTEGRLTLCQSTAEFPESLKLECDEIELTPASLKSLRMKTEAAGRSQKLGAERWEDLVNAVGEAAMNAVVHAGGGTARICAGCGKVQVWVHDNGPGIEMDSLPRATLGRGYTTSGTLGHGFWIITKMADRTWISTGPKGTSVVIEQEAVKPDPSWMRESGFIAAALESAAPGESCGAGHF